MVVVLGVRIYLVQFVVQCGSGVIGSSISDLPNNHAKPVVDAAFDFSIQHGGRTELDFFREPGVSYNPRPARVGLILLKVAGIKDSAILAAAMLATVPEMLAEARELFSEEVYGPAISAQLPPVELFGIHLDERQRAEIGYAGSISVALWLDRARHLHLSSPVVAIWRNFLEQTVHKIGKVRSQGKPVGYVDCCIGLVSSI